MQILAFVAGLLPKFGKDRLQEDISICLTELQNNVIPAYEGATEALATLNSKEAHVFERQWAQFAKNAKKGSLVGSIHKKLEDVRSTLMIVDSLAQKEFESEIVVAGMTVLKGTLVRMAELGGFIESYALRFLNYLYILETTHTLGKPGKMGSDLTPGEINLIKTHFVEFCVAVNAMSRDIKQTAKTLESIPEVLVNARGEAALNVFGAAKIDPLGVFQVQGFTKSPIYHVGLLVAEMQANRYKRAKELKSILELRKLNLIQSRTGTADTGVERELEILQSRIDSLDEKIRKTEESVQ